MKSIKNIALFFGVISAVTLSVAQNQWQSKIVFYGANGRLQYVRDSLGNAIPDFSYAGYKNSDAPIPDIPVVLTIEPISGNNTAHIQQAIDSVARMEPDAFGFRGALLLKAGTYEIKGTIYLNESGIVLRGEGDNDDPASNTILKAVGNSPKQRTVLVAGGNDDTRWRDMVPGTKTYITDDTVLVGSRTFHVQRPGLFHVGDNIIIFHPCTEEWLQAIDYGGTHSNDPNAEPGVDVPWEIGSQPIVYNRYITRIDSNQITIDAPLYNHFIKAQAKSYIYKYLRHKLKTEIGIENLRIDIQTAGGTDENHAWVGIDLLLVEDAWVRHCTVLHFGEAGFRTHTATRVTIEQCRALDPVSKITGGRRYNFEAYTASQQILVKECLATNGRHHYMSNGTSWVSDVVFLNCQSSGAYASSEGHRRWSQGLLYDNLKELDGPRDGYNPRLLGLYCRGYYGTSHGWAAAHSVAWNCDVAQGDLIVQKPPTAQNYAIGCKGKHITGKKPPASFDEPQGYIEGSNTDGLYPQSLFLAQLTDRHNATGINITPQKHNRPSILQLIKTYPNPFNQQMIIRFTLSKSTSVRLLIFNALGQLIRSEKKTYVQAGRHNWHWEGSDEKGQAVSSGIYFLQLRAENQQKTVKVLLVR